ncbi:hypothetical protein [Kribbella deserti]|uniref:GATA-type domain-containing protein n=1 Tax=Kribbella deserti TaxID=1926257 RepID=A0ABV6QF72_9ACTN
MSLSVTTAWYQPAEPLGVDERDLYCAHCGDDTPHTTTPWFRDCIDAECLVCGHETQLTD